MYFTLDSHSPYERDQHGTSLLGSAKMGVQELLGYKDKLLITFSLKPATQGCPTSKQLGPHSLQATPLGTPLHGTVLVGAAAPLSYTYYAKHVVWVSTPRSLPYCTCMQVGIPHPVAPHACQGALPQTMQHPVSSSALPKLYSTVLQGCTRLPAPLALELCFATPHCTTPPPKVDAYCRSQGGRASPKAPAAATAAGAIGVVATR